MKFADLTWQEIEDYLKNNEGMAILPLGSTEQQGPHLPVGWDNKFITELCLQVSEEAQRHWGIVSLVLPTIPLGPVSEHTHWPGYLHVSKETHSQIILEVLESLIKQGFKKVVVWSGYREHDLGPLIDKFNRKHEGVKVYWPQIDLYGIAIQVGGKKFVENGGHADAAATSWCLYLDPGLVRKDKIKNSNSRPLDWTRPVKDFSLWTQEGALGDVSIASLGFGQNSWKLIIKEAAEIIKSIYKDEV